MDFILTLSGEHASALKIFAENFKQACPHARGLVPIALMSAGLAVTTSDNYRLLDWENLIMLLEILPGSDDGEVLPDWLMGTRKWILAIGEKTDGHIGDLLTVFIEQMEGLVEQGTLKRDAIYERAMNFVEELWERREALGDLVVEIDGSIGLRRITQ